MEISVDWNDRIGDWSYYVGFNLYDSRTHITKYNNESQLLGDRYYREGMELGEIWGYDTDRFYTVDDFEEGTLQADLTGGTLKPGIPKVKDTTLIRAMCSMWTTTMTASSTTATIRR